MSGQPPSTAWGYDARGRVVTETKTVGVLGTYTTTYGYNSQDQVVSMRYPDPTPDGVGSGELITTTYNAAGWPAGLTGSLGDTYVSASTYNAQGQPKTIQLGGGLVTRFGYYSYNGWGMGDADDAPDDPTWANGHVGKLWKLCTVPAGQACPQAGNSSSVLDLRYGYDGVGNILNLRDKTGGGDELQTFTYDDLDRLTGVSGAYSAGYTYDAIGNLLSKDGLNYEYDPAHPHAVKYRKLNGVVQESYGYDANGNMTARADSLTYDAENRLESVTSGGETVSFVYDGDGRRAVRDTITETVVYVGPHYELRFDKTAKPEDLNDDCVISVVDIMRVARRWGEAGGEEDLDGSGTVDVADIQQVAGRWRETCHQLAETVKYYALGGRRIAMRKVPAGPAGTLYYLLTDHLGSISVAYDTTTSQAQTMRCYLWGIIHPGSTNTPRTACICPTGEAATGGDE